MVTLITLGILILLTLIILCFSAYKIKAESFEFSTAIWRIASVSITIKSSKSNGSQEERSPNPDHRYAVESHRL